MKLTTFAFNLVLALTASTAATAGQWVSDAINGEPGIRYDGANFGVIMSCNEYGNLDTTLITDKSQFSEKWGGVLRTGSLVLMRDQDPVVHRNAYREDDMAHLAVFGAALFGEHVLSAAEAADTIDFVLVEGEDQISFVANADVSGFRPASEKMIEECGRKHPN